MRFASALLLGLDDIGAVLEDDADEIAAFEANQRHVSPWLYLTPTELACFSDLEMPDQTGAEKTRRDYPVITSAGLTAAIDR